MEIRNLLASDWEQVRLIYEKGINTGNATFQTSTPSWEDWDASHLASCRVVTEKDGQLLGWAALTPVSSRCVYAGVAEVSVYVDPEQSGKGIGLILLNELVHLSEADGIWTLQAGIFPENTASLRIHEKAGFRILGIREKIGKQNGIWRDTVLLERRSKLIN
ncbi:N-acetyltransferase [Flavobacterium sp. ANB]|uniref:GNAT family N-acetyltransferase n=1 Tax=unclassified Flavobacterium TaxID=196869 RepID=UPI0012B7E7D9|nr:MULTISPECIES: GNAT family N-acetyltransferase [unclassified Flavobacterium]MBF4519387.1 N-acetyltransferase [Flavobacterium sp. ANB]MTD72281.1 GNAT family N-acetyltransferase [Flavobacterium sp. LC2016-13]